MTSTPGLPPRTVRVAGLAGARGDRVLFSGLDFTVAPGAILSLRGPNGAGKTSLLLMLAGIVRPLAGTIDIEGGDPERHRGVDLGYLGHRAALKPQLTVADNLRFWAALAGPGGQDMHAALDAVGLARAARLRAGYLSAGQAKRLGLARLLVSRRPVWLLDEPLASLDGAGEALARALIGQHLAEGGLAVAATHHDLGFAGTSGSASLSLGEVA